jgi:hypothetical protein
MESSITAGTIDLPRDLDLQLGSGVHRTAGIIAPGNQQRSHNMEISIKRLSACIPFQQSITLYAKLFG